jgi:hypothetical protein
MDELARLPKLILFYAQQDPGELEAEVVGHIDFREYSR